MGRPKLWGTIGLLLLGAAALADEGSYAAEFLTVGVGARAAAMGEAAVAIAEDATAAYWNPAGLMGVPAYAFAAQHADLFQSGGGAVLTRGLAQYNFLNLVLPFRDQERLAISWVRLSVDEIPRVTFQDDNGDGILGTYRDRNGNGRKDPGEYYVDTPTVAETFSNSDNALLISWARPIGSRLSIGVTGKWIRQSVFTYSGIGVGLDLGARYALSKHVVLGLSLQDLFGTRIRWNTPARPGFVLPTNPRLGAGIRLPFRRLLTLTLAADLDGRRTVQRTAEESPSRWHAGMELTLLRVASLRVGYDAGAVTAGAGFRIPIQRAVFEVDYAFMSHPDLGDVQRLSLVGGF
ncbi:MAG: hypothetical protein KatS3mg115_1249 [Candidatus Poribacteria bacterium]|nr:MAG: hypothetical protein KatS3mg115_1249 [Candidatus Poribacteria bacterium]